MMTNELNPGSDEALKKGCRCPVIDNGRGRGYIVEGQFVVSGDCPIHGWQVRWAERNPARAEAGD